MLPYVGLEIHFALESGWLSIATSGGYAKRTASPNSSLPKGWISNPTQGSEANVGVGFGKSMGTILFPNPRLPMGWNSELRLASVSSHSELTEDHATSTLALKFISKPT